MNVVPAEKQIKRKGCFKQGRVSVVVPVYNTKPCLRRSVNSVIEQTFSFIELILVDDGSTDGSSEICDEFAAIDDRVRVVHQQNLGPSAARNRGMEAASGDYLYFLDSDDWIAPDTIEKLYRRACMDRLDVLFFDGITTNEAGVIKQGPQIYCRQASYNGVYQGVALLNAMKTHHEYRVCIPLMFIRRAFLMKESLSFFEGILHEDELFSFMLMLRADRCGHVPEP